MTSYCVYVPAYPAGEGDFAEKIKFMPDGFSWAACFFGPFWCLWQKSWLALVLWLGSAAMLAAGIGLERIAVTPALAAVELLSILFGYEASSLLRRTLERRGMRCVDVVVAANLNIAEKVFFDRRSPQIEHQPLPSIRAAAWRPGEFPSVGLFPETRR